MDHDLTSTRSYEKWPFPYGRATYSALTLLIQYTLPVVTISVLHSKIGKRLRIRHVALESMAFQDSLKRIRERKVMSSTLFPPLLLISHQPYATMYII